MPDAQSRDNGTSEDPEAGDEMSPPPDMDTAIATRRNTLDASPGITYARPASLLGLALSGGGIRSSTLSLGIAQAFARHKRLLNFDYCSTVSGGGYFGSFMTSLFMPDFIRGNAPRDGPLPKFAQDQPEDTAKFALDVLSDTAQHETIVNPFEKGSIIRHPLWWLRQHSRYMAPNGPSDYQTAISYLIRNWTGLMFVIVMALAMLFATSTALTTMVYTWLPQTARWFSYTYTVAQHLPSHGGTNCVAACPTPPTVQTFRWSVSPLSVIPVAGFMLSIILAEAYWQTIWSARGATHLAFLIKRGEGPRRSRLTVNLVLLALLMGIPAWVLSPWGVAQVGGSSITGSIYLQRAFSLVFGTMAASAIVQVLFAHVMLPARYLPAENPQTDDGGAGSADGIEPLIVEIRRRLTRSISELMLWSTIGMLLVLLGGLGRAAYCAVYGGAGLASGGVLVLAPVMATLVAKVPKWFASGRLAAFLGHQIWNIALVVAILLYAMVAVAVDVGVQALAFDGPEWTQESYWHHGPAYWSLWSTYLNPMAWTWLEIAVMFVITGSFPAFLNLSSLHGLYGTRLTRAFLGASNIMRLRLRPDGTSATSGATDSDPGDQIRMAAYQNAAIRNQTFAPFHLVNTTLNETVSPTRSQLLERDRKGVPLVFAPEGVFLAASGKTDSPVPWVKLARAEQLDVGQLCAISGAAFSSGMGMNTTLGGALLLVFANIRLGYWWNVRDVLMTPTDFSWSLVGIKAWLRRWVLPTYTHLLLEMCGLYYRSGNYVNLSDGGHFENTGAYELLRRKVPTILVCDQGEDHACAFEDMENLIRKARIDLGMEITVPSQAYVEQTIDVAGARMFLNTNGGDWRESLLARAPLGAASPAGQEAFCLLLTVRDCEDAGWRGHILWMKPCLFDGAPEDVLAYARRNPPFPQQSTLDQFFDEGQWESYRKLGFAMGDRLLTGSAHGGAILNHLSGHGTSFP